MSDNGTPDPRHAPTAAEREAAELARANVALVRERDAMKPVVTAALEWYSAQTQHGIEFDTIMEFEHDLMLAVEKYRAAQAAIRAALGE